MDAKELWLEYNCGGRDVVHIGVAAYRSVM
jgi:hypothetical protein